MNSRDYRNIITDAGFDVQNNDDWFTYENKCPFCGGSSDGQKHLNMLATSLETDPVMLKCFRPTCIKVNATPVSEDDLYTLGINDREVVEYVVNRNKGAVRKSYNSNTRKYNYQFIENAALSYLYNRTSIKIDKDNISQYRIILDFRKFCEANNLDYTDTIAYKHSHNYIGFMDDSGSLIRFRHITTKDKNYRFLTVRLFKTRTTPYSIGILRTDISKAQKVYLAEGTFDILNIKTIINDPTGYYVSTNSYASMKNILADILKIKRDIEIVIVADTDVTDRSLKHMLYSMYNRIIYNVMVIRNTEGKDFGDKNEPYKINKYKI